LLKLIAHTLHHHLSKKPTHQKTDNAELPSAKRFAAFDTLFADGLPVSRAGFQPLPQQTLEQDATNGNFTDLPKKIKKATGTFIPGDKK
jgi:hypothetical protein